jgi:dihydroorotate dehydrogenase
MHGIDALLQQRRSMKFKGILGINIGKNADTPIEKAVDDYLICLDKAYPALASYITVNISSPEHQEPAPVAGRVSELDALLASSRPARPSWPIATASYVPSPSRSRRTSRYAQITNIADALRRHRIDGVIATNTTLGPRQGVRNIAAWRAEQGGLSGAPLFEASTEVVAALSPGPWPNELPIIAAGGVSSGRHARKPNSMQVRSWSNSTAASSTAARPSSPNASRRNRTTPEPAANTQLQAWLASTPLKAGYT